MWQSPEGQTRRGVTKASDIFSFGLVVSRPCLNVSAYVNLYLQYIYALGGGEFLLINDYQELVKSSITPEQEILIQHFSYFGPISNSLLKQVNNDN